MQRILLFEKYEVVNAGRYIHLMFGHEYNTHQNLDKIMNKKRVNMVEMVGDCPEIVGDKKAIC
jgi:hypothetical protein